MNQTYIAAKYHVWFDKSRIYVDVLYCDRVIHVVVYV